MGDQAAFRFVPARGEAVSFARMGFDLDWRRLARRARRAHGAFTAQTGKLATFEARRHFWTVALFEEIRLASEREARQMKRSERARGRRLSGRLALACTPEGRRAQLVIDHLSAELTAWEAASLCG